MPAAVSVLIAILTLLLIVAVIVVIGAPLRRSRRARASDDAPAPARAALEAAREAKYREIRDTELDYRTGKLSPQDYERLDSSLWAEALEILDRLAALNGQRAPRSDAPER